MRHWLPDQLSQGKTIKGSELDPLLERYIRDMHPETFESLTTEHKDEEIKKEIETNHQWKIVIDGTIACVWATTLNDEAICAEKDQNDAIYIHRIATNAELRGNNFVMKIVGWAKDFARKHNREYVRLDTLGNNTRLIDYYVKSGFNFLGIFELENTSSLPLHYQQEPQCCLFEVAV